MGQKNQLGCHHNNNRKGGRDQPLKNAGREEKLCSPKRQPLDCTLNGQDYGKTGFSAWIVAHKSKPIPSIRLSSCYFPVVFPPLPSLFFLVQELVGLAEIPERTTSPLPPSSSFGQNCLISWPDCFSHRLLLLFLRPNQPDGTNHLSPPPTNFKRLMWEKTAFLSGRILVENSSN